jgi:3-phosphoshikimate 1-carboxyvinyltransferase
VEQEGSEVVITGKGLDGLVEAPGMLDAGNSGSTMRMLSGVLAAQPFSSRIAGDESLSRRPMERIIKPLSEMGALIRARDGRYPPLEIEGRPLKSIEYTSPVASAQVKSCVLFAGLFAKGNTTVIEPVRTRDHTEIALSEFGAEVAVEGLRVSVQGRPRLGPRDLTVPGDISSAAFFLVAATMIPESRLTLEGVGLNPNRATLVDFLLSAGAKIRLQNLRQVHGEMVGDLTVESTGTSGGVIEKSLAAALIDEIPVLAVLGAVSEHGLEVRDAAELRVKETDRIASIADGLERMGIHVETRPDGFFVPGRQRFQDAKVDSYGDHRIAMAFSVAALAARGDTVIKGAEAASVSYPGFFDTLRSLQG